MLDCQQMATFLEAKILRRKPGKILLAFCLFLSNSEYYTIIIVIHIVSELSCHV